MLLRPPRRGLGIRVRGPVTNESRTEWKENRQVFLVNKIVFIIDNLNIKSRQRRFTDNTWKKEKGCNNTEHNNQTKTPHHEKALPGAHNLTLSLAAASFTAAEAHKPTLLTWSSYTAHCFHTMGSRPTTSTPNVGTPEKNPLLTAHPQLR